MALEVRSAAGVEDDVRDAFVLAHPDATFFHLSGWRRFVQRIHRLEPRDLVAYDGEELAGILPLMSGRGLTGKRKLVSMPFAVYGGPLGESAEVERELVRGACDLAEELRVGYMELRNTREIGLEMPGTDLYWSFLRDLPEDPSEVLARMPKKARAEARRARTKHGLELGEGVWYVDDLCRLFLLNKHALGSPALPAGHFHGLLTEFGDRVFVHLVHRGRVPLAAVMSFAFRDTLIAYYAGTMPGADRQFSASNFMYMALQEWAAARGFRVFDFCRSRKDSGAFRFKRHQGFEPTELKYRYHLVRARHVPSFTPSNPRTEILRRTWSRLPLWLAQRLSGVLSSRLP